MKTKSILIVSCACVNCLLHFHFMLCNILSLTFLLIFLYRFFGIGQNEIFSCPLNLHRLSKSSPFCLARIIESTRIWRSTREIENILSWLIINYSNCNLLLTRIEGRLRKSKTTNSINERIPIGVPAFGTNGKMIVNCRWICQINRKLSNLKREFKLTLYNEKYIFAFLVYF